MEKAFENVNWNSLFSILRKNGFGDKWMSRIRCCVTGGQLSILVNGGTTSRIQTSMLRMFFFMAI